MRITLVTPAKKVSLSGNRATALRWARLLRDLDHRVTVAEHYDGAPADLMVAIHAWRSADAVRDFCDRYPDRPLILCLAGTDIYRFQESDRSEEHTSELQSLMRISYAVFCLKKKN